MADTGENGCTVIFYDMAKGDMEQYVQSLKDLGYTEDVINLSDDKTICHIANNQNGDGVSFSCTVESGEGTVYFKKSN